MHFSFIKENPKDIIKFVQTSEQEIKLVELKQCIKIFLDKFSELKEQSKKKGEQKILLLFVTQCLDRIMGKTHLFVSEVDLGKNISLILEKKKVFISSDESDDMRKFAVILYLVASKQLEKINGMVVSR